MPEKLDLKAEIKKLIKLQEVDSEIFDLQIEKETFPGKRQQLDDSLEEKNAGIKSADEKLKELQVVKNEKENDLQAAEERIKKHEAELAQIKTNKEYKAMLDQIDSLQADVSLVEEKIIGLFDEIESAQTDLDEEKRLFEEEKKKAEKEKGEIDSKEKKVDARLGELKGKREELVKDAHQGTLGRYERILENRGRRALSKVKGEFCEECNMRLRPQIINEAKLMKDLVVCENCSRILYITED